MDITKMDEIALQALVSRGEEAAKELLRRERQAKLAEYNRKLRQLFAEAEADGVSFIYAEEPSPWCEILNADNCKAAC